VQIKSIEVSRIKEKVKEQLEYIGTEEENIEEHLEILFDTLMRSLKDKKLRKKFMTLILDCRS
jgi:hypothetical protein